MFIAAVIVAIWDFNQDHGHTLYIEGVERSFSVHLPKDYKNDGKKYPVLFVFHGNPGNNWQMRYYTGMNKTADKNDFIVVYPRALNRCWPYSNQKHINKELEYTKAIIASLKRTYLIDTNRMYFAGLSAGGILLSALSKEMKEEMAALILVASSTIKQPDQISDNQSYPAIPSMLIIGTNDFFYNGNRIVHSSAHTINNWLNRNLCDTVPTENRFPKKDSIALPQVIAYRFKSKIKRDVMFIEVIDGGHHWPNARFDASIFVNFELGEMNKDFETNQAIWDFASKQTLDTLTQPTTFIKE